MRAKGGLSSNPFLLQNSRPSLFQSGSRLNWGVGVWEASLGELLLPVGEGSRRAQNLSGEPHLFFYSLWIKLTRVSYFASSNSQTLGSFSGHWLNMAPKRGLVHGWEQARRWGWPVLRCPRQFPQGPLCKMADQFSQWMVWGLNLHTHWSRWRTRSSQKTFIPFPISYIQRAFCSWLEVRMGVGRLTHRLYLALSWLSRAGCSDRISEQSLLSVDTASLGM